MNSPTNQMRELCAKMGAYFHSIWGEEATAKIQSLGIQNIEQTNEGLTISTTRPGLLIGRRGETIGGLEKWMELKIKIVEAYWSWTDMVSAGAWDIDEAIGITGVESGGDFWK